MADQQTNLLAAISSNPTSLSQPNHTTRPKLNGVRCFYCHADGHIVRNCPRPGDAIPCTTCGGWGHTPQNCASVYTPNSSNYDQNRKFQNSLNFRRVPR